MATIRDIVMYEDVGFDQTHKHCLDFLSESDRDSYFDNLRDKTYFRDANYNKTDKMLNLECLWEDGLKFSYCSLVYGNKKMFFFVTGCKVVNEKVTGFELQMDMWQTFLFDFTVGEGMITREHVDRWDTNGNILWQKANTEDVVSLYTESVSQPITQDPFYVDSERGYEFYISGLFITYLKTGIKEWIDDPKTHASYITIFLPAITIKSSGKPVIVPVIHYHDSATGQQVNGVLLNASSGLSGDIFTFLEIDPKSVVSMCYQSFIPFEINTSIMSVSYTDYEKYVECIVTFDITIGQSVFGKPFDSRTSEHVSHADVDYYYSYYDNFHGVETFAVTRLDQDMKFKEIFHKSDAISLSRPVMPNDNDVYSVTHEPEMYKQPYVMRSLSDFDGSKLCEIEDICWIKNYMFYFNLSLDNQSTDLMCAMQPNVQSLYLDGLTFNSLCNLGMGFKLNGLQLDVPSDLWKSYIISMRDTDRQMLQSTINQQGIASSIGAIVGMGGISGMAGSGRGSGLGFNPTQALAGAGIGAVMSGAGFIANQYFGWQQQEIKEKAIRNQPNNLLRVSSGDGILKIFTAYQTYNESICNESVFNQASNRYHKYGYRVDMMAVPNIKTRKYFNFVQTSQIRIEGAMNQAIRDEIADIFNNGVTIWHGEYITKESGSNKFKIDYSMENIERSLI